MSGSGLGLQSKAGGDICMEYLHVSVSDEEMGVIKQINGKITEATDIFGVAEIQFVLQLAYLNRHI